MEEACWRELVCCQRWGKRGLRHLKEQVVRYVLAWLVMGRQLEEPPKPAVIGQALGYRERLLMLEERSEKLM